MAKIISQVISSSDEFKSNQAVLETLLNDLKQKHQALNLGGNPESRQKHLKAGKLLPRTRLARLLDPGTPFLELSPMAAFEVYDDLLPAAGIITGIGTISQRLCVVIMNDATVKGGCYYPLTIKKHLRAQEIAAENFLPCVYVVDSGGAYLPKQDEIFPDRDHFGRIFFNQAQLSAQSIPQLAIVMGSCTAGGAYIPAMADESIMVANQSSIFLAGPPLVKAATGEIISAEDLGGAAVHCGQSGLVDHYAESEEHALSLAKTCISHWPSPASPPPKQERIAPPAYPPEELNGIIPQNWRHMIDCREIIARIVDGSEFDEFKKIYATTLVCGFAHIHGHKVGIIANNGVLYSESALKGAHFVQLCCQRQIPLVFLQNITGFMVGSKYEAQGIAKHGALLIKAVASAKVAKFTIIVGGSFGAGNYAMCGRAFGPRFLWTWPNARISIMGGEQAAQVLADLHREKYARSGHIWSAEEEDSFKNNLRNRYEEHGNPYYATARLWDDGIIAPADTRMILSLGLSAALNAPIEKTKSGIFRF